MEVRGGTLPLMVGSYSLELQGQGLGRNVHGREQEAKLDSVFILSHFHLPPLKVMTTARFSSDSLQENDM